jgi:adenosylcobinamide-phosphate synthase
MMGHYITLVSSGKEKFSAGRQFLTGAVVVLSGAALFGAAALLLWCLAVSAVFSPPAVSPAAVTALRIVTFAVVSFLIKSTFSISALLKAADRIYRELEAGNLDAARKMTSTHMVSRDTQELSEGEISAAVIESLSENFTDSVISPWLYFLLGGPAGAVVYRFVNTCDSMIGYKDRGYFWFGKFAARLDDGLNFIPARLGGLIIVLTSLKSFRILFRDHGVTESPNAGWTMAAAAGSLGVSLVKKGQYNINPQANLPGRDDISAAVRLIKRAVTVALLLIIAAWIFASGVFV